MKFLELNTRMAVELGGQSLDTLDNMEYMMYSFYYNIVKARLSGDDDNSINNEAKPNRPVMVGLPEELRV